MDLLRDVLIQTTELPRDGHLLVVYAKREDRDNDFRRISPMFDMCSDVDKVGRFIGRVISFISLDYQRHRVRGMRFSKIVVDGKVDLSQEDYTLLYSRIIPREGDK